MTSARPLDIEQLVRVPAVVDFAVAPDGETVAVVSNRTEQFEISLLRLDSDEPLRQITDSAIRQGKVSPVWSRDGARLAFAQDYEGDERYDIFAYDLAGDATRNLTPDTDTGLGYWSEKELFNALRTGVKPDGKVLLPPMPWPNTAVLSDADLNAVVAYLQSLSPVKHAVPNAVAPDRAAAITGSIIDMPAPSAWDAPRPVDTGGTQK